MAYKKEYPVVNSELEKDSVFEYTKRQEDNIEGSFADLINKINYKLDNVTKTIKTTTPTQTGWESAKTITVPKEFEGNFAVVSAWVINDNNVLLPLDQLSVRPSRDLKKLSIELRNTEGFATNREVTITIVNNNIKGDIL